MCLISPFYLLLFHFCSGPFDLLVIADVAGPCLLNKSVVILISHYVTTRPCKNIWQKKDLKF